MLTGTGPIISAMPEAREQEAQYEALGLDRLRPRFYKYDDDIRVLKTVRKFPEPEAASPSAPEVISVVYETPGVEPSLSFEDFVRGVACVAMIVDPDDVPALKGMTLAVAERIIGGGDFPALDVQFGSAILDCHNKIFANAELSSWRPLLSFLNGAFWILSFIERPDRKRAGVAPVDWVHKMVSTFCTLAYVPR